MEPIVSHLTGEEHERSRFQVEVSSFVLRVLKVHRGSAFETESHKDFLKGRMGVHVWGDALTRHVVISRHLIKIAVFA